MWRSIGDITYYTSSIQTHQQISEFDLQQYSTYFKNLVRLVSLCLFTTRISNVIYIFVILYVLHHADANSSTNTLPGNTTETLKTLYCWTWGHHKRHCTYAMRIARALSRMCWVKIYITIHYLDIASLHNIFLGRFLYDRYSTIRICWMLKVIIK